MVDGTIVAAGASVLRAPIQSSGRIAVRRPASPQTAGYRNVAGSVESDAERTIHLARRRSAAPSLDEFDGQGLRFGLGASSEQPGGRGT